MGKLTEENKICLLKQAFYRLPASNVIEPEIRLSKDREENTDTEKGKELPCRKFVAALIYLTVCL